MFMGKLGFIGLTVMAVVCFADCGHAQGTVTEAPLPLFINGAGQVTPYQDGQMLQVGQSYEMTAIPDAGSLFSSWQPVNVFTFVQAQFDAAGNPLPPIISTVDSPVPSYSLDPVLDFTMQAPSVIANNPGLSVTQSSGWQANFGSAPEPSCFALIMLGLTAIMFRWCKQFPNLLRPPSVAAACQRWAE
jgi:Divergent InlB B-repeat domain